MAVILLVLLCGFGTALQQRAQHASLVVTEANRSHDILPIPGVRLNISATSILPVNIDKNLFHSSKRVAAVAVFFVWALGAILFLWGSEHKGKASSADTSQSNETKKQTDAEATFNVVNMYVGVGLWSLPFSVLLGGWIALPLLGVLVILCWKSAIELVRLQRRLSENGEFRTSQSESGNYLALAEATFGKSGFYLTACCLAGEFVGTSVVLILTLWDLTSRAFGVNVWIAVAVTSCMLVPFLFRANWHYLSYVNLFALLVTLAAIGCTFSLTPAGETNWIALGSEGRLPSHHSLVTCVGLQMVALGSGTPAITSIYASISAESKKEEERFKNRVLFPSFIAVGLFSLSMALGGFLAYGKDVKVLVTDNLIMQPDFGFTMALLVSVATFATTPPFVAITTEVLVLASNPDGLADKEQLMIRIGMFLLTIVLAAGFMHSLEEVIAAVGLLCMSMTAIVLPLSMSLIKFWNEDSAMKKVFHVLVILATLLMMTLYFAVGSH